ncbi:MAG TPA: zf-HC2 domain-containing protein, partial [Anaerolineaceae bacterium]
MDCERVRFLLDGYVDDELDLVNALDIEAHLKSCPDCARRYAELQSLHTLVAGNSAALVYAPPAGLRKR